MATQVQIQTQEDDKRELYRLQKAEKRLSERLEKVLEKERAHSYYVDLKRALEGCNTNWLTPAHKLIGSIALDIAILDTTDHIRGGYARIRLGLLKEYSGEYSRAEDCLKYLFKFGLFQYIHDNASEDYWIIPASDFKERLANLPASLKRPSHSPGWVECPVHHKMERIAKYDFFNLKLATLECGVTLPDATFSHYSVASNGKKEKGDISGKEFATVALPYVQREIKKAGKS